MMTMNRKKKKVEEEGQEKEKKIYTEHRILLYHVTLLPLASGNLNQTPR